MSRELIGLSTIECTREVANQNPNIAGFFLRIYNYIPDQTSGNERRVFVPRREFMNNFSPDSLLEEEPKDSNVALDSMVKLNDASLGYLLMADLAPNKSPENQEKIGEQIRKIIVPYFGGGFLLETRRSYHYLGMNVTDQEGWLDFLGRSLITSIVTKTPDDQPNTHEVIVDYRYVGHSILRRSTGLRITTNGSKTFEPRSVAIIE